MSTNKKEQTKSVKVKQKDKDESLSMDELDQVAGGARLRDYDTIDTTDVDDDSKFKI